MAPLGSVAPKPENDGANTLSNKLDGYQQSLLRRTSYSITLKFQEIVYKVSHRREEACCGGGGGNATSGEKKTILNGVTGMVSPGEILAMLGPSGSGKTTLLTALGGRLAGNISGKITYNGRLFSSSVKRRIGFVSQDDVLHQHLTVFETLLFTALLRLPRSLSKDEKTRHVECVIAELGLTRCRDSMIGGALFRGISGGERKRVSIGQEMLVNPSLILLDEPTSGLDSTTAQRILTTVKGLASGGRTIVTTIHQPSSRLYHMFDKVMLLSEGRPVYYGLGSSALDYFSSIGFSSPVTVNPADLLLDLANGIGPDFQQATDSHQDTLSLSVKESLISAYEANISPKLKIELCISDTTTHSQTNESITRKDMNTQKWCHEFKILLMRGLRERRFEALNRLRIFQVISVAILGGLLWWQTPPSHMDDRIAMLFFFSVFWGFYPMYNAVFTFPQERAMLIKERSSGMYRLSSYFLARTAGDLPTELALPTAFTCIFYWMGGLSPDPATFVLSLLAVLYSVLVAQSLGLAFGALLMDVKQAATLSSVTTVVFLVAGGYYIRHIPVFVAWLKYLSYSYYCYRLLLGAQYGEEGGFYECGEGVYCRVADFPAVKAVGLKGLWVDATVMMVMLVGYRVVAYLALYRVR